MGRTLIIKGRTLIIKGAYWADVAVGESQVIDNSPVITISDVGVVNIVASGALAIYYTTDGSTPTVNSTLYTGEFTIGAASSITAIASYSGGIVSSSSTATWVNKLTIKKTIARGYMESSGEIKQFNVDEVYGQLIVYEVVPGTTYRIYGPTPGGTGYAGVGYASSLDAVAVGETITVDNTNYKGIPKGGYYTWKAPSGIYALVINDNYAEQDGSPYVTDNI